MAADEAGTEEGGMKIKLRNTFHNTSVVVLANDGRLSNDQIRRAKRRLCGVSGCDCGGIRGESGLPAVVDDQGRTRHLLNFGTHYELGVIV